nr:CPBP family intramembrane metalloprotease [Prolixibacteraceae bacterium]
HVKIPEEFGRRFADMRSQNELVSSIGQVFLFLVYGLLGIGFILFVLIRQRYFLWKKALFWASAIGLATGLIYVWNTLPLLWFDYDTSASAANYIARNLLNGFLNSLLMGGIIFLSAVAGEGMGRLVFPGHIQFWKSWGSEAGASKQILGLTVGAYLFVPVFLAIDVLYYLLTTRYLGWWNPAGTLSDPNVLAETLPWYSSIAVSLQAGFWEELICRAVPLAGVYYLVRNRKSKNVWMVLTLLAQTIIFGMLHASYPQSPSFARVLEMIVPFVLFGLVYLRFGLLPLIITHFAVDVFWISLPLFVANTPGIWMNRIVILLLLLLPLWVVLYHRIRNKKWNEAPPSVWNGAWEPVPLRVNEDAGITKPSAETMAHTPKSIALTILLPLSLAALVLWALVTFPVKNDAPPVQTGKTEAEKMALEILVQQFDVDPEGWTVLTDLQSEPSKAHRFVWSTSREEYARQQERFLSPPSWIVRLVKKDVSAEERIEEYSATLGVDGRLISCRHILPEKRTGAHLSEEEATVLSYHALEKFSPDAQAGSKTVKITPKKLDARTDWVFEYADTLAFTPEKGQGRYRITLAGDQVSGWEQYVFIPEEWERAFDEKESTMKIYRTATTLGFFLLLIAGLVLGIINWTKNHFSFRLFLWFALAFVCLSVLGIFNDWDSITSSYFTGMPFSNFMIMTLIGMIIGFLLMGFAFGVLGGYSCRLATADRPQKHGLLKAILIGILWASCLAVLERYLPKSLPRWTDIAHLNSEWPSVGLITRNFSTWLMRPLFVMILFYLANNLSAYFTRKRALALLVVFAGGFFLSGNHAASVQEWLISGGTIGLFISILYLFLHRNVGWIPVVFIVPFLFETLAVSFSGAYPSIIRISLLPVIFALVVVFFWNRILEQCRQKAQVQEF